VPVPAHKPSFLVSTCRVNVDPSNQVPSHLLDESIN
jgi:hypothetical protein